MDLEERERSESPESPFAALEGGTWVGGWDKATTGRREVRKRISVESTGNGSSRGWGQGKLPQVVCCRAVD